MILLRMARKRYGNMIFFQPLWLYQLHSETILGQRQCRWGPMGCEEGVEILYVLRLKGYCNFNGDVLML